MNFAPIASIQPIAPLAAHHGRQKPTIWMDLYIWKHPNQSFYKCCYAPAWTSWDGMDQSKRPQMTTFVKNETMMHEIGCDWRGVCRKLLFHFDSAIRIARELGLTEFADAKCHEYEAGIVHVNDDTGKLTDEQKAVILSLCRWEIECNGVSGVRAAAQYVITLGYPRFQFQLIEALSSVTFKDARPASQRAREDEAGDLLEHATRPPQNDGGDL